MTSPIQHLVEALRTWLQHHGGLLAPIEVRRGGFVTTARTRHGAQQKFAWLIGQPESHSFREVLPFVYSEHQPLIEVLIAGINRSISNLPTQATATRKMLRRGLEHTGRWIAFITPLDGTAPVGGEINPYRAEPNAVSAAIV